MSFIKSDNETYIIAEIGQNHNGDINIAKKIIDQVDHYTYDEISGNRFNKANGIKLIKRDLTEELSKEQMDRPYTGPNSFGATYGEHREFLELSYEETVELGNYIRSKGFDFVLTLCSVKTLQILDMVTVDKIKIASRDMTNIPLIEAIAKRPEDVVMSIGMSTKDDLTKVFDIFVKHGKVNFEVMHCISQYPAEYSNLNLHTITYLKEQYPGVKIGYSDHSIGTHIPVAAVAMGAEIIEKHVTLDTNMKGTDHKGSANISTFHQMVHDIRSLEFSKGVVDMQLSPAVAVAKEKLERSLAFKKDIKKGQIITEEDLHMLSPGGGLTWWDREKIIGKAADKDHTANSIVKLNE